MIRPALERPGQPWRDALAYQAGCRRLAGVDEAGRGPWAGPVVAAAVVLRRRALLPVRIDDSKRLTAAARARAWEAISRYADVGFGIASADEIDRLNILRATLLAMQRAVEDLPRGADLIVVDGCQTPSVSAPCRAIISGDRYSYSISCASIMAKVLRDALMAFYHTLRPAYAFHSHKGYGTLLHGIRLRQFGPSVFHRMSFRPVRDTLASSAVASHEPVQTHATAPAGEARAAGS